MAIDVVMSLWKCAFVRLFGNFIEYNNTWCHFQSLLYINKNIAVLQWKGIDIKYLNDKNMFQFSKDKQR